MTPADYGSLRSVLIRDEGLRLKAYVDSVGKITIGYGRNLTDDGISQLEALDMLNADMTDAVSDVQRTFPIVLTLTSARQVVLAALCFNIGVGKLSGFTKMWTAIRAGDFETAATEMLNSEWASEVGARATRYAEAMRSGELL